MSERAEQLKKALQAADAAGDTEAATKLAGALRAEMATEQQTQQAQQPLSRNPLKWVLGAGDAGLSMATGMVSSPVNNLIAAGAEALPGGRTGESVMERPPIGTYQPRTPEGQAIMRGVGTVLSPVATALEAATEPAEPSRLGNTTMYAERAALGLMPLKNPVARTVARRAARARVPSTAQLREASQQAYRAAETAGEGLIVPQAALADFANKVQRTLAESGARERLHPSTFVALDEILQEATNPNVVGSTFKGLETMRRVLSNAENAAKAGSDDARLAAKMVDDFDDFVDSQSPQVGQNYAQARELWNRMRKSQEIESLFERAQNQAGQFTQSGMENALRTQFRQLADNPRRFRRFNAEERAAILKVVRGGPIQNVVRWAGKLAPRGVVSASAAALLGEGIAPGGSLVLMGLGETARRSADALRGASARRVGELVRAGNPRPTPVSSRGVVPPVLPAVSLGVPPVIEPVNRNATAAGLMGQAQPSTINALRAQALRGY